MSFGVDITWQDMDEIGFVRFKTIIKNQKDNYNIGELKDQVIFDIIDRQDATVKEHINFYRTVKNRDQQHVIDFMYMIDGASNKLNSGIFSGLKYGVSSGGNKFLVITENVKII